MNSFLKILGLIICILGCIFTNMVWIEVPVLGEVKGLNNGAGIIIFGAFFIGVVLYFISLFSDERGIYWGAIIFSAITLLAGFYYYQNVQTIVEKLTSLSNISVFGVPVGNVYDKINISWKSGFGLSMFMGGISVFISFVLLLIDEEKPQSKIVNSSNNQQNTSYSIPIQKTKTNPISNFDNQPYIEKLKELFELNQNGVISNEIYEQERAKILEQQKVDKSKFEEQEKSQSLKQKSDLPNPIIEQNPQNKNRPSYISKPLPQKKTTDPNIIFVIVTCLLLVGFAVYSLSSNKSKSNSVVAGSSSVNYSERNESKAVENSEIKIDEFNFETLYNKYGEELATETTNFSLKNGNKNKVIFVSAKKAYVRINDKYEVFEQKSHNVNNGGFKSKYSNKKFSLLVVGSCKEKPDAVLEGEMDCEGTVTIEDNETKSIKTVYYTGVVY